MSLSRITLVAAGATVLLLAVGRAWPGPAQHAVAGVVGLLTLVLVGLAWRERRDRGLRWLALAALGLVLAQGAYGALTARGRLPAVATAGHLALSLTYLLTLVLLAFRAHAAAAGVPRGGVAAAPLGRRAVVLGAGLVLLAQVLLGSVVRHAGAGAACGTDLILCDGRALPAAWPESLHLAHRYVGWLMVLVLGGAHVIALREARRLGRPFALLLARLAPVLVMVQIGLGLWSVATWTDGRVGAAHLALAALLVANLGALHLALGPLGHQAPSTGRAPAGATTGAAAATSAPGGGAGRVGEVLP